MSLILGFFGLIAGWLAAYLAPRLTLRLLKGRSAIGFMSPGPQCLSCARPLTPIEALPAVGYVFCGGRCKGCGSSIPLFYPAAEILGIALGVISAVVIPQYAIFMAAAFWILLAAAIQDHEWGYISDLWTLGLLLLALIGAMAGVSPVDSIEAGLGFGAAVILPLISWLIALRTDGRAPGFGLGDVKLAAGIGALLGPTFGIAAIITASAAAIGFWFVRRQPEIHFGPFLAGGAIAAAILMLGYTPSH